MTLQRMNSHGGAPTRALQLMLALRNQTLIALTQFNLVAMPGRIRRASHGHRQ
jgi:hypothetical protein